MSAKKEMEHGFDRRNFLKGVTSATLATGLMGSSQVFASMRDSHAHVVGDLPDTLLPHPIIDARHGTEGFWNQVRKAFALPNDYIHMNTGTTGSQPLFALNNLGVYHLYKSQDPRDWESNLAADYPELFPRLNNSAIAARQAAVAAVYGANPEEVVLSYNTTDACNLIFAGTPWQPGDRIITTSFEHPALAGPIAWARDYHGVEVVIIDMPSTVDAAFTVAEMLAPFEQALMQPLPGADNKQYVAFSEIFYKNGLRMPVAELCALARSYGGYSIVDTAHGWGMLPIDCHAYGADFIAGAGHKWLCGGPGTGICYVRTAYMADTWPLPPFAIGNFVGYGNLFQTSSTLFASRAWLPSSSMQSRGEYNRPALYAMTDSLAYFDYVGIDAIYARGVALGEYLKLKIEAEWGVDALWVQRNPDTRFATALTSFNPFAAKNDSSAYTTMRTAINDVLAALAAETPKIYIRSVTWRSSQSVPADDRIGFRVSTHAMYNSPGEIDHVFDRVVYHMQRVSSTYELPLLG
jgi:selenocysteine lyase/cysteine desulfurase